MATVTIIPPRIQSETGIRLRVAAYCRVSSSSDDQLNSYMAQMTYYSHKFDGSETEILTDIYADEGITGTRDDKRTEFQRMIRDCRKGKIDRIYTKSISRFARNTKDCLEYLRELKSLGISVFFEKENIDTARTSDEMMVTILGGLAQEESHSISENMKWSVRKRMAQGIISQSSAPYGYDLKHGQLVVNEAEAAIVRQIFDMFLCGMGYRVIMQTLNEQHQIRKNRFGKWTVNAVSYVLHNERYIGDSLWQKNYNEGIPVKRYKNYGRYTQYYIKETHTAIISTETFYQAQRLMELRYHQQSSPQHYPLTRKIACGHCGSIYRRREQRGRICWICQTHDFSARDCPKSRLSQETIYEAFIRLFCKLQNQYSEILIPMLQYMQAFQYRKNGRNSDVIMIHQEIAKLREQSHVLASLRTKGFLNEAKYQEQMAELNRKIGKQQKQLHLLTQNDENDEVLQQLKQLADYFADRKHPMIQFEPETFELLAEYITVHGRESLDFHLIGGLTLKEPLR